MSVVNLQNKPIVIGSPIEIESAVNDIRTVLAGLTWVSRAYFIAQRFTRKEGNKRFFFPETYAPDQNKNNDYGYQRLTPDNDQSGSFFFYVGRGEPLDFQGLRRNLYNYPVAIIFNANLELIDKAKLRLGLFTGELIRDARRLLTDTMMNHLFNYRIVSETRDLREVYREFVLDNIEQYNRAPMQCFRIDLEITVQEDCP